ncbi:hypothetical protein [Croceivirga thetidis]|uniref:Riboflavin synthase subunit beta n=1 Tax=Croceivirga thetidis TaxID=2721623 RepID=A0ABX1GT73_9FLAO|nr:hypothetical protein [Croceivirga thetidis]NKI32824.1 hypothetical protein [Croceivirga thetidis]
MRLSVFKKIRNKSFNYVPRYYDERKERLEQLRKKYENLPDDTTFANKRKSINFRDEWLERKEYKAAGNSSARFFVILAILFFAAYLIIRYFGLEHLFFNA